MIRQHLSGELMTERTVFITGGGSGINLGIAKTFAAVGASSQCGNRRNAGRTLSSAACLPTLFAPEKGLSMRMSSRRRSDGG